MRVDGINPNSPVYTPSRINSTKFDSKEALSAAYEYETVDGEIFLPGKEKAEETINNSTAQIAKLPPVMIDLPVLMAFDKTACEQIMVSQGDATSIYIRVPNSQYQVSLVG